MFHYVLFYDSYTISLCDVFVNYSSMLGLHMSVCILFTTLIHQQFMNGDKLQDTLLIVFCRVCFGPRVLELMKSNTRHTNLCGCRCVNPEGMWIGGANVSHYVKGQHENQVLGYDAIALDECSVFTSFYVLRICGTGNHEPHLIPHMPNTIAQ